MLATAEDELLRLDGIGVGPAAGRPAGRLVHRPVSSPGGVLLSGRPRPRRAGSLIGYVPQKLSIDPGMPPRATWWPWG